MDLFPPQDLRVAAQRADRSSGPPGRYSSKRALEVWEAVVDGSYSLVEWFDTDTRRFIVVRANPPGAYDPRGLTNQERDVAGHAALGEANKLIAFRMGVSPTRVSALLCSATRKLDLRNKAQLVYWVRGLGLPVRCDDQETHLPAVPKSA
jgi:DNA-binding NarL/FixJ family response regulator